MWHRQTNEVKIESLEKRQLLSASITGTVVGTPAALVPGVASHATIRLLNSGDARASGKFTVSLYASSSPAIDADSVLLSSSVRRLNLRAGGRAGFQTRFNLPDNAPIGNDYLVAKVDAPTTSGGSVPETIFASQQTISVAQPFVDLSATFQTQPTVIFVSSARAGTGRAMIRVSNQGNIAAQGPMQVTVYASTTGTIDARAIPVGIASIRNINIKAGASKVIAAQLAVPAGTAVGNYTVLAAINSANTIAESDTSNNIAVANQPLALLNPPTVVDTGHHHDHGNSGGGGAFIDGRDNTIYVDTSGYDTSTGIDQSPPDENTQPSDGGTTTAPAGSDSSDGSDFSGDTSGGDFGGGDSGGDDTGGGADF